MRIESDEDNCIDVADFCKGLTYKLRLFFQQEGARVCLNVIKDFSNMGKFYIGKTEFETALKSGKLIVFTDTLGKTFRAVPTFYQDFNISVSKSDLFSITN